METKIIQITAGRGPEECHFVVAQVLKKVIEEANDLGLKTEVLDREQGNQNTSVISAIVMIQGKEVEKFVQSWVGTIKWIGQSQIRQNHKRKNWFIGIFESNALSENAILENDIEFQAMRSSGAGGQHVNKVSSAIRATHKPTGISVVAMDSRSQHQNKKIAIQRLLEKLQAENINKVKEQIQNQWENQLQIERGNSIRTFTGSDFKTDKKETKYKSERNQLKKDLNKILNKNEDNR